MEPQSQPLPAEPIARVIPQFVPYTRFPAAEQFLETHLGEASKVLLPPDWRKNFVQFFPWIALAFLPFMLFATLGLVAFSGIAALFNPFVLVTTTIAAAAFVFDVIALPGLFKRSKSGWTFFLYSIALGSLGSLLGLDFLGLLFEVLLFWLAFQIKYLYS